MEPIRHGTPVLADPVLPLRPLRAALSTTPTIASAELLASPIPPLAPETICEQVRDAFVADPGLFALPVVTEDHTPVGLVNRFKFLERLASPFGRELVIKKPVSTIMDVEPLTVDASTGLD